jgi:hypothetical protein
MTFDLRDRSPQLNQLGSNTKIGHSVLRQTWQKRVFLQPR